jgi:hypothetical protein
MVQFAPTPEAAYNVQYRAGQLLWDAQAANQTSHMRYTKVYGAYPTVW